MSKLESLTAQIAPVVYDRFVREGVWEQYSDWRDGVASEAISIAIAILDRARNDPADRERRIRELAFEWIRNGTYRSVQSAIEDAASRIDALDAAEVPPKDAGGES